MTRFRQIEIIEPSYSPPSLILHESATLFSSPKPLTLPSFPHSQLFNPNTFDFFDTFADLGQIENVPFSSSYYRIHRRAGADFYLQSLCDRVSSLESSYNRLVNDRLKNVVRKYTWAADIKDGLDRKYTWTTEIKSGKNKTVKEKNKGVVKSSYKWTTEIKGKGERGGPVVRSCMVEGWTSDSDDSSGSEKEEKKKKKDKKKGMKEEIVDVAGHRTFVLRQAFAKRDSSKGKKELSPLDAANMIQLNFKAYLIRRSQTLRALRELAIAKTKLKEIRGLFHNFAYRHHLSRDAEERQRFSEKIIVLLLSVDAIVGADVMARSSKRSMVDELDAMLEVVDPQSVLRSLSMRRRTFDLPSGVIQNEIAAGVAKVVQMLNQEENDNNSAFDVCG